jgi:hypothetical protein
MAVDLKKSVKPCRATIFYDAEKDEDGRGAFNAHICLQAGEQHVVEYQTALAGSRRVITFYEVEGMDINVYPKYVEAGDYMAPEPIQDVAGWKAWLANYAAALDPVEVTRDCNEAVGDLPA